ncbi:MAG TPA: hypothetical protein VI958_01305 [Acidobacteriota bacterium]
MSEQSALPPAEETTKPASGEQSKLKLDPNLAGALCYLFGCLSGILFFVLETENKRIRFHALQSILIFAVLFAISFLSALLSIFTNFVAFQILNSIMWALQFVVWVVMVIRTYQGSTIKIPGLGDFAREQVGWP